MNAEIILACWAAAIIAAVALCRYVNAGERRRHDEQEWHRAIRRYNLTHPPRSHSWMGDEE